MVPLASTANWVGPAWAERTFQPSGTRTRSKTFSGVFRCGKSSWAMTSPLLRCEQQQHPQQAIAVVLPGLGVGGDAAGVVVADHHDDPGAQNRQQRQQPSLERAAVIGVPDADPAERAFDVAQMGAVQHRRRSRRRGGRRGLQRSLGRGSLVPCGWVGRSHRQVGFSHDR
ncbi:MAG: hypothetical protein QOJ40_2047, partial [Verrucomicrobiota bacterium]